jgi:hypothetical protein
LVLLGFAGLAPIGIAWADRAESITPVEPAAAESTTSLIRAGERVVEGLGRAHRQLEASLHTAEAAEDQLLVTCLGAQREELGALRSKAILQFRAIEGAPSLEAARAPYSVMVGVARRANAVIEAAAHCVGDDGEEATGSVSVIEPPVDADLYAPADSSGSGAPGTRTSSAPGNLPGLGELPIRMPRMPTVASPMR